MEGAADSRILIPARAKSRRTQNAVEQAIKLFFGGNALVAVIVLALITIFLFREGFGFFGQNLANLRLYRQAGLEYVDIIRSVQSDHEALTRKLSDIRLRQVQAMETRHVPPEEINGAVAPFDQFAASFSEAAENLRSLVSDLTEQASALKEQLAAGDITTRDAALQSLRENGASFETISSNMMAAVQALLAATPRLPESAEEQSFQQWKSAARDYLLRLPAASKQLREWSPDTPIPWYRSISSFLFGREWATASFWQDWYGIIPLFVGSVMVSFVALVIAVPLGIASAIYVSEVACRGEKRIIKPYIEFISAIPSVVLGFFGIAVVGQAVRAASQSSLFNWVSFFPISERLNIFTAGCLLALMAGATIFTLAGKALPNVPRGFQGAPHRPGGKLLDIVTPVLLAAAAFVSFSAVR